MSSGWFSAFGKVGSRILEFGFGIDISSFFARIMLRQLHAPRAPAVGAMKGDRPAQAMVKDLSIKDKYGGRERLRHILLVTK